MCSIYFANSVWASMHSFTSLLGTEPMTDHSNPMKLQANQTSHFTRTRTLYDFPLLIGEILRRADLRLRRQARRRARIRTIGVAFGIHSPSVVRLQASPRC
jgi:hypothetical protein